MVFFRITDFVFRFYIHTTVVLMLENWKISVRFSQLF